jgi:NAD(P)-dependent dehydrogenase (short-subunit alcohol dehydrogenase family)
MSIFDRFRLDGRRALVTGGSRGLGREMALAMADAGADLVLIGRDPKSLAKTAEDARQLGCQVDTIEADMGNTSQCEAACQRAVREHGPLDILINNVGGRRENIPTTEISLEKWQELMDLNLTSAFICTKLIGSDMIEQGKGGRIINISSINAFVTGRGIAGRHYETAKAALVQFTRTVAVDWAPHGITANAICPGLFLTEPNIRWSQAMPEMIEKICADIPLGEPGQPEDLGPLVVYLASDAARFMTGATLVIDGGYTLC